MSSTVNQQSRPVPATATAHRPIHPTRSVAQIASPVVPFTSSTPLNDAPAGVPSPLDKPTLSVIEAGQLLGIGRNAAYAAARAGSIPTLRFGTRLRVPTAAVIALLGITPQRDVA